MVYVVRLPALVSSLVISSLIAAAHSAYAFDSALLEGFSTKLSEQICSDKGQWLKCYRIEPLACTRLARSLIDPCAKEVFGQVTETLSFEKGVEFSERFRICFNARFEKEYGSRKLSSPACQEPPPHLRATK